MFEKFDLKLLQAEQIKTNAIKAGHLEVFPPAPRPWRQRPLRHYQFPRPSRAAVTLLNEIPRPPEKIDRARDQLDDPARDTRAQFYQDSSHFWDSGIVAGNAYECARFKASPDQSGVVKLIWTYIEIYDEAATPPYVPLDPGDPFAPQKWGVNIRWHLRNWQGTFKPMTPFFAGPTPNMPGYGYGNLPYWSDQRYVWGRTAAIAFFLVPASFALRLFAEVVFLDVDVSLNRIGGRLIGYTQPIDVLAAGENVKYGW